MAQNGVFDISKILISKQITTHSYDGGEYSRCIRYFKDTNFEANYNPYGSDYFTSAGVFDISKILISKQITTETE